MKLSKVTQNFDFFENIDGTYFAIRWELEIVTKVLLYMFLKFYSLP